MEESFQSIAQSIINESIKSAVFIDDKIPMLFSDEEDNEKICKPLYESFKQNQCSLDFFKFDNTWSEKSKLLFERKDLLVLDWELDINEPKYLPTLKIIDKAVATDNLHFVCIYSHTDNALEEIFYKILAYYSGNSTEVSIANKNAVVDFIDELGENSDEFLRKLQPLLKELTLGKAPDLKLWNSEINVILGKHNSSIRKKIRELFPRRRSFCDFSQFGFTLSEEYHYKEDPKDLYVYCDTPNNYLQINNTLFAVFKKGEPQANDLYNQFCNAVINANENFLTLMSLEIRNKVLERSAFIGKELSNIKEKAFFHHMENVEPETAFEEYLIELWKNYNTGFLYTEKPQLFSVLDEYKKAKADSSSIDSIDLAKLNYHYNIHYNPISDRNIGFGDFFKIEKEKGEEYLLCITPHCDCLRPEKINGFYYFVKGQKTDIKKGLALSDSGFISFVKSSDEEILCVEWNLKPFTLYLCEKQRNISTSHAIVYGENVHDFYFAGTIKENYTQRITNKAFSNPMRVGISFVKKEMDDSCEKYTKKTCPYITE